MAIGHACSANRHLRLIARRGTRDRDEKGSEDQTSCPNARLLLSESLQTWRHVVPERERYRAGMGPNEVNECRGFVYWRWFWKSRGSATAKSGKAETQSDRGSAFIHAGFLRPRSMRQLSSVHTRALGRNDCAGAAASVPRLERGRNDFDRALPVINQRLSSPEASRSGWPSKPDWMPFDPTFRSERSSGEQLQFGALV